MHYIVNLTRHSPLVDERNFQTQPGACGFENQKHGSKKSNIEASKVKQKIQNHHHGYAFSHFEDNFLMRVVY